ncbi:MAG: hypothetical protein KDE27_32825 [Planctomycetes bacterium]|nr:hypothetical protein [Planctomycetota bacterium]
MTPSDEYPHGWDVEWVAVDAQDRIAIFTTAGDGPIPRAQLARWAEFSTVAARLLALPETGGHELLVTLPRPDDFVRFARQGYFAYDWDWSRGGLRPRYRLQARPLVPRLVDASLDPDLLALLGAGASDRLNFGAAKLDIRAAFECEPR